MLFLAVSCDLYPERLPPATTSASATSAGPECDPAIVVPAPFGAEPPAADPHEDTFGAAPEPFHVVYGWPSSDPSTSASFLWRTDADTLASVVEWGVGGELTERAEGASFLFGAASQEARIHELKLCRGLEPATTYSYRVGGEGHWSETYTFTTPGAPGSFDTFRVGIAGDARGAYETWGTILHQMDAFDPDFFLFSGDMVDFGVSQSEWDAWFEASADIFPHKALIPAHGNHEFLAPNYFAQWSLPNNEEWFDVRYGDAEFIVLNDTVRDLDDRTTHQVLYQQEVLAASTARWKVAMHHQPVYSTCTRHGSNEELRADWVPVWEEGGVDLVIAGHNHIYERSVPILDGQEVPPGEGVLYLVSGGGGADLYEESEDNWFGAVAQAVEHFVIADFGPDGIHAEARDLSGNVIDTWDIPR